MTRSTGYFVLLLVSYASCGLVTEEAFYDLLKEVKELRKTTENLKQCQRNVVVGDSLPLGTILPWLPTPSSNGEPDSIPAGWVQCDGSWITEGQWAGLQLPNLNGGMEGKGVFLRGGTEAQAGQFEQDAFQVSTQII